MQKEGEQASPVPDRREYIFWAGHHLSVLDWSRIFLVASFAFARSPSFGPSPRPRVPAAALDLDLFAMTHFKHEREDYFDSVISPISPAAFQQSMMNPMLSLPHYAQPPAYVQHSTSMPTQADMMAAASFAPGNYGFMDPMQHHPKVWPSTEFDLNYADITPMAFEQPMTSTSYSPQHMHDSRPNSMALSHTSSHSFAASVGYAGSSASMSRTSSLAPSLSGMPDPNGSVSDGKLEPPEDVHVMGYQDEHGEWRCKHEGCTSKKSFTRACDLRKHFRLHEKSFFCSKPDCPWSRIGFSLRKDCRRHEASHKPDIECPAEGCDRTFSRSGTSPQLTPRIPC